VREVLCSSADPAGNPGTKPELRDFQLDFLIILKQFFAQRSLSVESLLLPLGKQCLKKRGQRGGTRESPSRIFVEAELSKPAKAFLIVHASIQSSSVMRPHTGPG
jgi:hypothetical protein